MTNLNPLIVGSPTADGYKTRGGAMMTKAVATNGTTEVNIFGATNGFEGSVVNVKVTPKDATAGSVRVYSGNATGRVLLAEVVKASAYAMSGSAVTVSGAFTANGTLTAVSTSSGESEVEVTFTAL